MNMRSSLLALVVALLFCLCFSIAAADNKTTVIDPTGMVNLNKNQALHNALLCLKNTSNISFPVGGELTEKGLHYVNGTPASVTDYCQKGAVSQIVVQLHCMELVYNEFRFNDDAQLSDINTTLVAGCNSSASTFRIFNSTLYVTKNGAGTLAILNLGTIVITVIVALASLV